jgi:hypothetical protein
MLKLTIKKGRNVTFVFYLFLFLKSLDILSASG